MDQSSPVLFAVQVSEDGQSTSLDGDLDFATQSDKGYIWVSLLRDSDQTVNWLRSHAVSEDVIESLTILETRPRALPLEKGLLVVLRGVNANQGADPEDMISLRLWFDGNKLITMRQRQLYSLEDVRKTVESNKPPASTADIVVMIIEKLADRIGEVVDDIDEQLTILETNPDHLKVYELRRKLSELRRQTASIRRFLAPQRDALTVLYRDKNVLNEGEAYDIQHQADRYIRHVEDLDLARERALVLQEELTNILAEQQNSRMYLLSIVAAIFLPLSFLTGVFGMNVAGLPWTENPLGFLFVTVSMLIVGVLMIIYMRWKKWL